jgi:hypothetical protein
MTIWEIPTETLLYIHVVLSLIGIASGLAMLYGLLNGNASGGWTALFLLTTILTGVTGFPLDPPGFDPARKVGVILLVLLTAAVISRYLFNLIGAWRWVYVISAVAALYLNVFVGVVQAFQKTPFLKALAPTQDEAPFNIQAFQITQAAVLAIFVILAIVALVRFHPGAKTAPSHAG